MTKFTAGALAVLALCALLLVGCGMGVSQDMSGVVDTGYVTVRNSGGERVEFIRPNKEIIEMGFAPLSHYFVTGESFSHVYYKNGKDQFSSIFVKAVLDKEAPAQQYAFDTCGGGGCITEGTYAIVGDSRDTFILDNPHIFNSDKTRESRWLPRGKYFLDRSKDALVDLEHNNCIVIKDYISNNWYFLGD